MFQLVIGVLTRTFCGKVPVLPRATLGKPTADSSSDAEARARASNTTAQSSTCSKLEGTSDKEEAHDSGVCSGVADQRTKVSPQLVFPAFPSEDAGTVPRFVQRVSPVSR